MKLGQIGTLRTGLVLIRKKAALEEEIAKTYQTVSLKNINENGSFNDEPFDKFESNEALEQGYFTEEKDVLIRLSEPHTAVYIDSSKVGLLVPSSLVILKVKSSEFLPEYIAWYLNSQYAKRELRKYQTGTAMAVVNISVLREIKVKKIPLKDQEMIANIQELHLREQELLMKLIEEKTKFYQAVTNMLMNGKGVTKDDKSN